MDLLDGSDAEDGGDYDQEVENDLLGSDDEEQTGDNSTTSTMATEAVMNSRLNRFGKEAYVGLDDEQLIYEEDEEEEELDLGLGVEEDDLGLNNATMIESEMNPSVPPVKFRVTMNPEIPQNNVMEQKIVEQHEIEYNNEDEGHTEEGTGNSIYHHHNESSQEENSQDSTSRNRLESNDLEEDEDDEEKNPRQRFHNERKVNTNTNNNSNNSIQHSNQHVNSNVGRPILSLGERNKFNNPLMGQQQQQQQYQHQQRPNFMRGPNPNNMMNNRPQRGQFMPFRGQRPILGDSPNQQRFLRPNGIRNINPQQQQQQQVPPNKDNNQLPGQIFTDFGTGVFRQVDQPPRPQQQQQQMKRMPMPPMMRQRMPGPGPGPNNLIRNNNPFLRGPAPQIIENRMPGPGPRGFRLRGPRPQQFENQDTLIEINPTGPSPNLQQQQQLRPPYLFSPPHRPQNYQAQQQQLRPQRPPGFDNNMQPRFGGGMRPRIPLGQNQQIRPLIHSRAPRPHIENNPFEQPQPPSNMMAPNNNPQQQQHLQHPHPQQADFQWKQQSPPGPGPGQGFPPNVGLPQQQQQQQQMDWPPPTMQSPPQHIVGPGPGQFGPPPMQQQPIYNNVPPPHQQQPQQPNPFLQPAPQQQYYQQQQPQNYQQQFPPPNMNFQHPQIQSTPAQILSNPNQQNSGYNLDFHQQQQQPQQQNINNSGLSFKEEYYRDKAERDRLREREYESNRGGDSYNRDRDYDRGNRDYDDDYYRNEGSKGGYKRKDAYDEGYRFPVKKTRIVSPSPTKTIQNPKDPRQEEIMKVFQETKKEMGLDDDYIQKMEEQKRKRNEILRRKEAKRKQMMAGGSSGSDASNSPTKFDRLTRTVVGDSKPNFALNDVMNKNQPTSSSSIHINPRAFNGDLSLLKSNLQKINMEVKPTGAVPTSSNNKFGGPLSVSVGDKSRVVAPKFTLNSNQKIVKTSNTQNIIKREQSDGKEPLKKPKTILRIVKNKKGEVIRKCKILLLPNVEKEKV